MSHVLDLATITVPEFVAKVDDYIENYNPDLDAGAFGILGGPGTGKTAIIRARVNAAIKSGNTAAKSLRELGAGLLTPGDIMGCAMPDLETGTSKFYRIDRLLNPDSIHFIDELSNADRASFASLTSLLLDGVIQGHDVVYKHPRLFAFNPTSCSDLAQELPIITVNRSSIYQLKMTAADDLNWRLSKEGISVSHPVVTAFIAEFGDSVLQVREWTPDQTAGVELPDSGRPFPSPRAFTKLSRELFAMERINAAGIEGVKFSPFQCAGATIGSCALQGDDGSTGGISKKFGDYFLLRKFLPSIKAIMKGENASFPDAAYLNGRVMTSIGFMTAFNLIPTATKQEDFENATRWMLLRMKDNTFTKEMVLNYAAQSLKSVHKSYASGVLHGMGKSIFGDREWVDLAKALLKSQSEVESFV